MSFLQQQVEEFDYMREEGEMVNLDHEMGDEEFEIDENDVNEYDMLTKITDTSATQARQGKDIQGIPWDRLSITRENYRLTRLEQYRNYQNVPLSGQLIDKEFEAVEKGGSYYEFFHNSRLVKPTILHFQVSTMAIKENFLVAGGFQGELICKRLDKEGVSFCARTTHEDDSITNAVEIYDSLRGVAHFMASNNDCGVREYEMEGFQLLNHFRFPWPVNHTSISPDRRLIVVVGDHTDGLLVDSQNGKTIGTMVGHRDYSFATSWHPDGRTFATGNQDKTCRVWDTRNLSSPTAILKSNLGAVRSIRYSSDGRFLVVAEPADFVHIYSVDLDYQKQQEIDFFGEISGVALSPDDESLYVGIWDRTYASLLLYNRKHNYGYLDSYL